MTAHPAPSRWRVLRKALAIIMVLISYLLLAVWAAAVEGFAYFIESSVLALGLGLLAFAFGYAVTIHSPPSARFGTISTVVALVSAVAQALWVLGSLYLSGKRANFSTVPVAFLGGWHLAAPPSLAALLWLISPPVPSSTARPVIAGLLFSLLVVALLAIPLGLCLQTFHR